jgi:hypothetical protein
MPASTGAAIKAWLESGQLGIAVYRRRKPKDHQTWPYATVDDRVTVVPDAHGDNGADASVREQVQVNVYQRVAEESPTLVDGVTQRLHGAAFAGRTHIYGVTVDVATTVPDPDPSVLHDVITVSVRRALQEA